MRTFFYVLSCCMVLSAGGQVPVTGFPSLSLRPNSRAMGMGDLGIASSVGTQSLLYNPAASAFGSYQHQLSVSYLPWLTAISKDTRVLNAAYLYAVTEQSAFGVNLTYLDMGQIDLRDNTGATLASYRARDYHLAISYALQFASQHSLSVTMKFMGQHNGTEKRFSFSGDIGYYGYGTIGSENKRILFGVTLTNLGPEINLPATAAVGIGYLQIYESGNQFTAGVDLSRLIKDDWKGMRMSAGMEYGFAETFFLRGGLSLENAGKGDRKYFSFGAGYKGFVSDQSWGVDLFYLVPFGRRAGLSPFQNVHGLSLLINIGSYQ